jgi:signal transduction histidine kinase
VFDTFDLFVLRHFAEIVSPILETINTVERLNSLNRKLEHAERIRRHEVNAPLAAITGNASFVLKYLYEPAAKSKERRLREINSDVEMCAFLVKDVNIPPPADFRTTLQYVSPRDLLFELVKFLKRLIEQRADLKIAPQSDSFEMSYILVPSMTIDIRGSSPRTLLNKHLMQRAFFNLGMNAVKYGVSKGSLIISVREDPKAELILIEFVDDGIGIDEEDKTGLFSEGFRGKNVRDIYPGMGLGLSIAKAITEAHNGRIEVVSMRKPTTFRIVLPIKRPPPGCEFGYIHPSVLRIDSPGRGG